MPMHDWTRIRTGTYYNFHYRWIAAIMDRLNSGMLPEGCFAMAEQVIGGPEPDVVTLSRDQSAPGDSGMGTIAVAEPQAKPTASFVMTADSERYARKANRIVVRHEPSDVLAVIEVISPGNKDSQHAIRAVVDKSASLLFAGINLMIIDPLPPTPRDPNGIHALIWSEVTDQSFELPTDRRLTLVSYQTLPVKTAYVEPIPVGSPLPSLPLFLQGGVYITVPLEQTYVETWQALPKELRRLVE